MGDSWTCCHTIAPSLLVEAIFSLYNDHSRPFGDPSRCIDEKTQQKWSSSSWNNWSNHSSRTSSSSILIAAAMRRIKTMYSIGMIASFPYTNLNDVYPVNLLQVVRYSHNTIGIFKSQSLRFALHTFVSACSNTLLNYSMVPFSCGWYGLLFLCYICNSFVNALAMWWKKWLP